MFYPHSGSASSPQRDCFVPTAGVLRPHSESVLAPERDCFVPTVRVFCPDSGSVLSPQRECFVSTAGVFCPHGKTVASPQLECYPKGVKKARLRVTQKNEGILGALILLLVLRRVDRGAARIRITFCPKCFRLTGAPGTKERRIYTKYQVYIYIYPARIRITFRPKCFGLTGAPGTKKVPIYPVSLEYKL